MKKILFLILISNLIYADLLVILKNNTSLCVSDDYRETSKRYTFKWLPYEIEYPINKTDVLEIKSNYSYNLSADECEPITTNPTNPTNPNKDGLIMGMTEQNFNFAVAIWGIALSFLISIGLIISF